MIKPDREAIETAYRAGVMSLREIASQHSISHVFINKRAKKEGWEKDLSAKVKAKADTLVNKREVNRQVNSKTASQNLLTERQLIEATAEAIANVRMEHRGDIRRARS